MAGGTYTAVANQTTPNTQAPSGMGGMLGGMFGNLFNQLQLQNAIPQGTAPTATATAPTPASTGVQLLPSTPIDISADAAGASKIDPALRPFLTEGLRQAQNLFLGANQPRYYEGQTYVSPSQATQDALATQEALARAGSPILQQAQGAYQGALGGLGFTGAGGFLQGNPFQQAAMQAATRPIEQQFSNQVLPSIASLYSKSGRYGSGAMQNALGQATEAYTRGLGDITSNIAGQQYQQERGLQQQAQLAQAQLASAAPQIYGQQFLPSQQLAQVGSAREAIAAQPLQEQIARFNFGQQLPYQQLSGYLSSVYGSPMGSFGTQTQTTTMPRNPLMGGLAGAGLGYLGGQFLGGSGLMNPVSQGVIGAGLGGVLGSLLF